MTKSAKGRCRTSSRYIYYSLELYSSGLSLRRTSERLSKVLIKEIMFPSGIGFNDTSLKGYFSV
jgi:hypothetical protein